MNVLELLARTTAHGVQLGQVSRSTLRASPQDIEWLMVGLSEFQEHLIRAAYQLDKASRHQAWAIWFRRLMAHGWQTDRPRLVENLTTSSLDYWLSPKRCSVCHGVGEVIADDRVVTCEHCAGTGRHERSPTRICRGLGLPRGHVYPEWISRWHAALAELDREESDAARHMISRLDRRQ